jgi:Mn-dependent DtxR family transcriptional regulator
MTFSEAQIAQLLKPIAAKRVLKDGKGFSHVSQQDITAHLIRVLGFGAFDTQILSLDLVYEKNSLDRKTGKPNPDRWDVGYRATLRLTIRDPDGAEQCHYEDGSMGVAQNQALGDAHDLAMKSAISLAKKRCAINLGDNFGLSLYNKGQTAALVIGTLIRTGATQTPADMQAGVEQQVTLGRDETDQGDDIAPHAASDELLEQIADLLEQASTRQEVREVGEKIAGLGLDPGTRAELKILYGKRMKEMTS